MISTTSLNTLRRIFAVAGSLNIIGIDLLPFHWNSGTGTVEPIKMPIRWKCLAVLNLLLFAVVIVLHVIGLLIYTSMDASNVIIGIWCMTIVWTGIVAHMTIVMYTDSCFYLLKQLLELNVKLGKVLNGLIDRSSIFTNQPPHIFDPQSTANARRPRMQFAAVRWLACSQYSEVSPVYPFRQLKLP